MICVRLLQCDMEGCRYDGSTTARRHGFRDYFITSAKTGEGISYAVEQVVREVSIKILFQI